MSVLFDLSLFTRQTRSKVQAVCVTPIALCLLGDKTDRIETLRDTAGVKVSLQDILIKESYKHKKTQTNMLHPISGCNTLAICPMMSAPRVPPVCSYIAIMHSNFAAIIVLCKV